MTQTTEDDRLRAESERLLDAATADAATTGVETETRTVFSHRGIEELFDLDTSVLMAERPTDRSLRERLFGRR
ncbi:MAG: hypothetical protein ACQET5_08165 [Halobacteriota archaeon]|uniref:hypothetical protein n=1 Tax=Natronomonas sp. TaxID=2184060 RepID=UPI003975CBCE